MLVDPSNNERLCFELLHLCGHWVFKTVKMPTFGLLSWILVFRFKLLVWISAFERRLNISLDNLVQGAWLLKQHKLSLPVYGIIKILALLFWLFFLLGNYYSRRIKNSYHRLYTRIVCPWTTLRPENIRVTAVLYICTLENNINRRKLVTYKTLIRNGFNNDDVGCWGFCISSLSPVFDIIIGCSTFVHFAVGTLSLRQIHFFGFIFSLTSYSSASVLYPALAASWLKLATRWMKRLWYVAVNDSTQPE